MTQLPVSWLAGISFRPGSYAEGIKNGSFSNFLLFYYNHVLGLSGSLSPPLDSRRALT